MITIKVYKNGYEIIGHAHPHICSEVSLWHWCTSNLFLGLDEKSEEYTSERDEKNKGAGYSWLVFSREDLKWTFDDLIISAKRWQEKFWKNEVTFIDIDDILDKKQGGN